MTGDRREDNDRRASDEIQRTLGRMESRLDSIEKNGSDVLEYTRDVSDRVRSLEVSRGWLIGAGAGAGGLVGWLTGFFK